MISLEPQFIEPQDGETKQDCENAAGKRWLGGAGLSYVEDGLTILGDDLYCNQPMCELLLKHGYNFILTCKYSSHTYLAEWIEQADATLDLHEHVEKRWDGTHRTFRRYRFANGVPIKDGEDALSMYWMELAIMDADGNKRARHDFGHGKQHLPNLLLSLNLLAFLFHTLMELYDPRYRLIRTTLPRRDRFFHDVKALTQYMLFDSREALMLFMHDGLDLEDPGG